MAHSKKDNYKDVMIFWFSFHKKKKSDFCNICEQEKLKSNFCSKNKNTLLEYILALVIISFLLHNNLIHKVWVDLTNEKQHKTQGFLGKMSESHGINLRQLVLPENYNYLNPTELLDLCCSVVQFILWDCGSIAVV